MKIDEEAYWIFAVATIPEWRQFRSQPAITANDKWCQAITTRLGITSAKGEELVRMAFKVESTEQMGLLKREMQWFEAQRNFLDRKGVKIGSS